MCGTIKIPPFSKTADAEHSEIFLNLTQKNMQLLLIIKIRFSTEKFIFCFIISSSGKYSLSLFSISFSVIRYDCRLVLYMSMCMCVRARARARGRERETLHFKTRQNFLSLTFSTMLITIED